MAIIDKIRSLISAANTKTGESDTTLTDAVQTLVDGYGHGGVTTYTDSTVAMLKTVPEGAVSPASVTKIGGKSMVWSQLLGGSEQYSARYGVLSDLGNGEFSLAIGSERNSMARIQIVNLTGIGLIVGHKYYVCCQINPPHKSGTRIYLCATSGTYRYVEHTGDYHLIEEVLTYTGDNGNGIRFVCSTHETEDPYSDGDIIYYKGMHIVDLTAYFGAGNEPSGLSDSKTLEVKSYLANHPEHFALGIKNAAVTAVNSSTGDSLAIPAEVQAFSGYGWGTPSASNSIEWDGSKWWYHKRVGVIDLGTMSSYAYNGSARAWNCGFPGNAGAKVYNATGAKFNGIAVGYTMAAYSESAPDMIIMPRDNNTANVMVKNAELEGLTQAQVKTALTGVLLYYELESEETTDISALLGGNTIPVAAGGTLTFANAAGLDMPNEVVYQKVLQNIQIIGGSFTASSSATVVNCGFAPDIVLIRSQNDSLSKYTEYGTDVYPATLMADFRDGDIAVPFAYVGSYGSGTSDYAELYCYVDKTGNGFSVDYWYCGSFSGYVDPETVAYEWFAIKL